MKDIELMTFDCPSEDRDLTIIAQIEKTISFNVNFLMHRLKAFTKVESKLSITSKT